MKLFKQHIGLLFIVLVSLLPLFALLHDGLPLTHDGRDHVARVASFYASLSEGNLIPRWAENLNWGFGHPILMFLYPASSYFASFFHLIGFSFVDSVKLVFGVGFVASGIAMYLWTREYLGKYGGIIAAVLYLYAPYRFVDLYIRGAIGEHTAFIFAPLVCYFLLKLSKKNSYLYLFGGTLSLAGLILAHNALLIMFLPFILFYMAYLVAVNKKSRLLLFQYVTVLLLGFGLSAFFIVPAFLEGKYTLRDIVTSNEAIKRFVDFRSLIYGPWLFGGTGVFSVQLGIAPWISLILSPFVFRSLKSRKDKGISLYLFTIVYLLGSLFLMLSLSTPVWQIITVLQKFQFPWRFLSSAIFATAILGGSLVYVIKDKTKQLAVFVVLLLLTILPTISYWAPQGYLNYPESFYTGIYNSTTDTGESAPIWSVRFMEQRPKDTIEVIDGEASVRKISRSSTAHIYEIDSRGSRIKDNTVYFPGWNVYINGSRVDDVQFQDPQHRGLITFNVPEGKHLVEVKFEDTRVREFSNYLSLASLITLIMILGIYLYKK